MISNNNWVVSGTVTDIKTESGYMLVTVKGNISRPNVYNVNGIITCEVPYRLCKSIPLKSDITLYGKLVFGKDTYIIAEKVGR